MTNPPAFDLPPAHVPPVANTVVLGAFLVGLDTSLVNAGLRRCCGTFMPAILQRPALSETPDWDAIEERPA